MDLEDWVFRLPELASATAMERPHDDRVKQATIGSGILIGITLMICLLMFGWRSLPGVAGEWLGTVIGIMTTPFFMESSFLILGLVIVLALNTRRRLKDGDDFVYLEQVSGPDLPKDLPEQAKWAMYREKPLDPESPSGLTWAEGALAIGEHQAVAEWIGSLEPTELKKPDVLELRLRLAQATGRTELAGTLQHELEVLKSDPLNL